MLFREKKRAKNMTFAKVKRGVVGIIQGSPGETGLFLVWGVPRGVGAPLWSALPFGPLKATDLKPAHGYVLSLQKRPPKKMAKISSM